MRSQPFTKINLPGADWLALQSPYVTLFCLLSIPPRAPSLTSEYWTVSAEGARPVVCVFVCAVDVFTWRASNFSPKFYDFTVELGIYICNDDYAAHQQ